MTRICCLALVLSCLGPVAQARADEERALVLERVIDATPAEVWRMFTTEEGAETWMAAVVEVDLRIGGAIRTNYDAQGEIGDANTITNRILCYEPERMLAIQNVEAPEGFPFAEGTVGTWTVIYFEPTDDGRTRVRMVGLGWPDTPAGEDAYRFFERGNAYALQQLAQALEGQAVERPGTDGSGVPEEPR
jgi:uncharacterized protein YndB with AHSA1/START domain